MAKAFLTRKLNGDFRPTYDDDKFRLKRIKGGDTIEINFVTKRNYKFLQKYMVLMNLVFENLPEKLEPLFKNVNDLRRDITMEAGYFEIKHTVHGEEMKYPKSISFAKMEEPEFEKLYNASIASILQWYLVGTDEDELREAVAIEVATKF